MAPIYQPPVPFSQNVSNFPAPVGGPFAGFQVDETSLTSAQILALNGTPITLVAAPGAGLMIIPIVFVIRVVGVTAAYTDGGGGAVTFSVGSMTATLSANTVFTGPTDGQESQQVFLFTGLSTAANPSTNVNAALTISKATGNFAAGSGTSHITAYYTIEPVL